MEANNGKWRFTSPTHTVSAFAVAIEELMAEGGVAARHRRYLSNAQTMIDGMIDVGLEPLLPSELRSPIITSFRYPASDWFDFRVFYEKMKARRFVLYPGKVSEAACFRIGTIGHVFPDDMKQLVASAREVLNGMSASGRQQANFPVSLTILETRNRCQRRADFLSVKN